MRPGEHGPSAASEATAELGHGRRLPADDLTIGVDMDEMRIIRSLGVDSGNAATAQESYRAALVAIRDPTRAPDLWAAGPTETSSA